MWRQLEESADAIRDSLQMATLPETLLILGSGFKGFESRLQAAKEVQLDTIPHFPVPKVAGHGSTLVCGNIDDRPVCVLTGRVHMYEGFSADDVVYPIRSLSTLGVQNVVLTNAAGSLQAIYQPGDLALIGDQINFTGRNCLIGSGREFGEIFIDMGRCYDEQLRRLIATKMSLPEATYVGVLGPTYETPAEVRMFAGCGGDIVGMSTVQEAIAAHQLQMRVVGLSFVTNMAGGIDLKLDHADVIEIVERNRKRLIDQLSEVVGLIASAGQQA